MKAEQDGEADARWEWAKWAEVGEEMWEALVGWGSLEVKGW